MIFSQLSSSSCSSSSSEKKTISRTRTRTTTRRNHFAWIVGFFSILLAAFGAVAQTTNGLSDAEIQGRKLAQQLLEQLPITNSIQNGILEIRDGKKTTTDVPVRFQTMVSATDWQTIYETTTKSNRIQLIVGHAAGKPNRYYFWEGLPGLGEAMDRKAMALSGSKTMRPFASSDFWIADLGLEFFHWPGQKILKKEFARGHGCMVLESTNPDPSTNGYSRVVSWIDEESGGIVQAKAYDFNNKLLKEFEPKSFKKDVNGQWQLQEMEIYNDQTRSRTQIKFDLKAK